MTINPGNVYRLDEVCGLFGMSPETATARAKKQDLPFPAFRVGSNKSPFLVYQRDFDAFIKQKRDKAHHSWKSIKDA